MQASTVHGCLERGHCKLEESESLMWLRDWCCLQLVRMFANVRLVRFVAFLRGRFVAEASTGALSDVP